MTVAHFSGLPKTEWLDDGRSVRLLENFIFTDANGVEWLAEENDTPDGSSIPKFAWTLIGSPFVGKHRNASIPHDKYCVLREKSGKSHEEVHRMYYEACLCAGVNKIKAKLMYLAIRVGGPKWKN